ncbi:iron-sulfur cluster assembly protein [Streptomyces sp. NPDC127033]|uniref:iron-sulfur cluster assembly protein n=1 Tax=Streptomyces sp. NPDC127033 TaxID=3347110 RepID=UPI003667CA36
MTADGGGAAASLEDRIRDQLRKVPEPCALLMRDPLDICEMGLVEEIRYAAGRVRITLVLTDTSCVHFAGMRRFITDVLLELPEVDVVEVGISRTVLWTPDRRRSAGGPSRTRPQPPSRPWPETVPVKAVDSA